MKNIRIVLVETSHPGNIGSAARAMKTMGLTELYLVNPKKFPHPVAVDLAAGSNDILDSAVVVDSLEEALHGVGFAVAASARKRDLSLSYLTPRDAAGKLYNTSQNNNVAMVFGRECSGLTNNELLLCNGHVIIDANPEYSSLNLAQAVQVLAYEFRVASLDKTEQEEKAVCLADFADIDRFYKHLEDTLIKIDFLDPQNPKKLMPRLKRLFNRSQLEAVEVNILRGILTAVEKNIKESINGRD